MRCSFNVENKIGNQSFIMLLYLLLFDAGLYGFGFRWVSYPANIMIILTVCSGIYVVRLITGNAYVGPSTEKQKKKSRGWLSDSRIFTGQGGSLLDTSKPVELADGLFWVGINAGFASVYFEHHDGCPGIDCFNTDS